MAKTKKYGQPLTSTKHIGKAAICKHSFQDKIVMGKQKLISNEKSIISLKYIIKVSGRLL